MHNQDKSLKDDKDDIVESSSSTTTSIINNEEFTNLNHNNNNNNNNDDNEDTDDDNDDDDDDDDDDDVTESDDNDSTDEIDDDNDDGDDTESDQENISTEIMMPLSPNSTPTCYICLNIFEGQDIGSPDSCETMHHFCLECIEEWGKQINTCPVDRKSFSFIIVRRTINGEIVMKVPIAKKSVLEIVTIDNDDVTYCEICGRCDREDRLLLCDGCDFGYHCECLVPPLETIPVDEWFCPDCFERLFGDDANEENNQRRLAQRRAIARTGTFERVRNRILARRSNVGTRTTKTKRKTKQRRRRRTTKKRKTTKTKTSNKTKTKRTRRRKYRKRTKKSKLSMKRLPAADPRSRLATRLGLVCKPKSPFGLPVSKPINQTRSLSEIRQFSGISGLSMFGYGLEMNHLSSYNDDLFDSGAVDGSSAGSLGLLTNTRHHIFVNNKSLIKTPTEPLSLQIRDSSNIDVLSEIMTSQEILHASSSDLSIARDGRVYLKAESSSSNNSIRQCPNNSSPNHSSSPPQSSSTNNGNSCKNHSSDRRSSLSGNSYLSSSSSSSSSSSTAHQERTTHTDNISFIKPSPVVSLTIDNDDDDKNIDIEMYSDIESLQDDNNKDLDENHPDDANDENDENHGNNQLKQPQEPVANIEDDKLLKIESDINQTQNLSESGEENSKNDTSIKNIETKVSKKSQQAKLKRRPSINDLFGDNSEDEDDRDEVNELKQLVAQQGGINVHFPIKMPIVLKTNFLSDKNKSSNNNDDDVPLSKKWVPIYPEMNETSKNSGPKWKAIGANSESNQKSKSESKEKFEKVHCDVDRKNEKSMNNNRPKLESKKQEISSKLQSSLRKVKDEENQDIFPDIIESVKIKKPVPKVKDETQTKIPTKQPDIKKNSPKNSTSSEAKIRTCKHGRPLAHKNKELSSSSTTTTSAAKRSKTIETTTSKPVHSKDYSSKKHEHSDLDYNHDDRYDRHRKFSKNEHPKLESKAIICPQPSSSSSNVKINQSSSNKNNNDNRLRDSSTKDESSSSAKKHRHHHHHHHHHRHHHRHKHDLENSSSGTISGHHHHSEEKKCVEKKSNLFQSYSKIDSKEIFAQGDKIIINVNFKKQEENQTIEKCDEPKKDVKLNKSNTIETMSPELSHSDDSLLGKLSDDSISSPINFHFDDDKSKTTLSSSDLKNVFSDELKFLPKIIPNSEKNNQTSASVITKNVENRIGNLSDFDDNDIFLNDDSFLPTPTQDESQSPVLMTNTVTRSKQSSTSAIKSTGEFQSAKTFETNLDMAKDSDFYDPELPLQSPDHSDHSKSPNMEKISFESTLKSSLLSISKDSIESSSRSNVAAKLASLSNFTQILEYAQTLKQQNHNSSNSKTGNISGKSQLKGASSTLKEKTTNHDIIEIVDMDVVSPNSLSPIESQTQSNHSSSLANVKEIWDQILKTNSSRLQSNSNSNIKSNGNAKSKHSKQPKGKFSDGQPTSAVDMVIKEKFLKKLNRQERVIEEVKLALKPYYQKKKINKDEYKNILRKAVPKICHSKSGEINPSKINKLVEAYIKHFRHIRKKS